MTTPPLEAPENVCVIRDDGTKINCTVTYEGDSIADDGKAIHDWIARPEYAFAVRPGEKLQMTLGTLPARTSVKFEMFRRND